jgi:biopolymer transport protein ExbB
MKITFSGYTGASNLDDFPVLIHLTGSNFDFTHADTNGEDIRFMDSDICPSDGTPLKHEIEKWDAVSEDAWVWVKVPRIDGGSATDYIYMFYGNAGAADGQDPPNVWDSGFRQVLHLPESAGTHQDSTADNRDGTPNGTVGMAAVTKLDGADTFANNDAYITSTKATITHHYTAEAWVYVTGYQGGDAGISNCINGIANGNFILIYSDGVGVDVQVQASPYFEVQKNAPNSFTNNWRHLVITYDGAHVDYYQDGASFGHEACTGDVTGGTNTMRWGWGSTNASYYHLTGRMDELRFSDITRSADWILATYKTQAETLQTYGSEEPV